MVKGGGGHQACAKGVQGENVVNKLTTGARG